MTQSTPDQPPQVLRLSCRWSLAADAHALELDGPQSRRLVEVGDVEDRHPRGEFPKSEEGPAAVEVSVPLWRYMASGTDWSSDMKMVVMILACAYVSARCCSRCSRLLDSSESLSKLDRRVSSDVTSGGETAL